MDEHDGAPRGRSMDSHCPPPNPRVALLVPCFNEEKTVGKVVDDFRRELPDATIYVYDNDSTDETARIAEEHGAEVRFCPRPGKGRVVQQMLTEIDADIYIMVDGDDTYEATAVHDLLAPVANGDCDMCVGNRLERFTKGSFSALHLFGNKLVRGLLQRLYHTKIDDILSGFRAFNRTMASELNLIFGGFEVETELNIKAAWHGFRISCVPVGYSERPKGSFSKIRTVSDGYRILMAIFILLRESQPVMMAGVLFAIFWIAALALGTVGWLWRDVFFFGTGVLIALLGTIVFAVGIVLHSINVANRETEEALRKLRWRLDRDD